MLDDICNLSNGYKLDLNIFYKFVFCVFCYNYKHN